MQLPAALRQALDARLDRHALDDLRSAGERLSGRYRAEIRDGRRHLDGEPAVLAYLAARMPATFAAIRASLEQIVLRRPDFAPETLLDIGAGPGTALWAANDAFDSLREATLVEASAPALGVGQGLAQEGMAVATRWVRGDATADLAERAPADLVTLAYVLDELPPEARGALVLRLWQLTQDVLVIVEPGTPAGWQRILAAREQLLAEGAQLLAPCPHADDCPVAAPDWCHFAQRVARSRTHRLAKRGTVPYEDEKFAYLAVARRPAVPLTARVLASPRSGSGKVQLKICTSDGQMREQMVTKREGEMFRTARRLDWGDAME
ncbi:MAG TPA: small ribosomal subunit Rsm22 family protein [Aurantimonas sp.]